MNRILEQLWVQNALVVFGFGLVIFLIRAGSRNERWQRAFARLRRDRLGLISGIVIAIYLFIGALDMVRLPIGHSADGMSVMDSLTRGVPAEKSYSAPLARTTLSVTKP